MFKMKKKHLLSFSMSLLLLFTFLSPSFAEKTDSLQITLYPGESKVLEVDASWDLSEEPSRLNGMIPPGWRMMQKNCWIISNPTDRFSTRSFNQFGRHQRR